MYPHERLARAFIEAHPDEAAAALERMEAPDAHAVLLGVDGAARAALVERLTPALAVDLLGGLPAEEARRVVEALPPRAAATLLQRLDAERREEMLAGISDAAAGRLRLLLQWPLDTAGALMDPHIVSLPVDSTVGGALEALRRAAPETVYYLYVVDRAQRLVGVLTMRDLLLNSPATPIERIVRRDVVSVTAMTDRAVLAEIMRNRRFVALPVVDDEGRLLGAVRHDEVIEAAEEEVAEDIQRMVGAGADERTFSPARFSIRKRLPWLTVNLGTAFLAAAVVGLFEETIARLTVLAVLLPVVAGQAGNTGAQSLAVVIRGLALREVLPGRRLGVLKREAGIALANGLAIGALTATAVYLWYGAADLATVIGLAMVGSMLLAGVAGAAVPLALKSAGQDPAQSSSIVMTTVTDVVGFASFLGLATVLL